MDNEKNVLLELTIFPADKGVSVSEYVSEALDIIDKSGLEYRVNPMGTVIEGAWEEVFAVVDRCFAKMREKSERINVNIKVDYRNGRSGRLGGKIDSLEKRLGRELQK